MITYANVVATLALLVAVATGTAYAANTVFSRDIVDGQVKTVDLANGAVAVAKLADGAITGDKVKDDSLKGQEVENNSLKGADIDESTLSNVGGGGPAGGDLTGTYPNPTIGSNALGGAEVIDASLTGADIDESTLTGAMKQGFPVVGTGVDVYDDFREKTAVAYCPSGSRLTGGGWEWSNVGSDSVYQFTDLKKSGPSFTVANRWEVSAGTHSNGSLRTLYAVAYCIPN